MGTCRFHDGVSVCRQGWKLGASPRILQDEHHAPVRAPARQDVSKAILPSPYLDVCETVVVKGTVTWFEPARPVLALPNCFSSGRRPGHPNEARGFYDLCRLQRNQ